MPPIKLEINSVVIATRAMAALDACMKGEVESRAAGASLTQADIETTIALMVALREREQLLNDPQEWQAYEKVARELCRVFKEDGEEGPTTSAEGTG